MKYLDKIIQHKTPCYFISPHLDDAVYSAGGLIRELSHQGVPVTIVTVFTEATSAPYSLSAKKFLRSCGFDDAQELFRARKKEDKKVCASIGAKCVHLGFVDGAWRKKKNIHPLAAFVSKYIPEFSLVYPIFRFFMDSGRISSHDLEYKKEIIRELRTLLKPVPEFVLFCPVAGSLHVDHVLVHQVCMENFYPVVCWADYPYSSTHKLTIHQGKKKLAVGGNFTYDVNTGVKSKLIEAYKTQRAAIFGTASLAVPSESYFIFS